MTTSFNKTNLLLGSFIVLAIVLGFWSYTHATGTTIYACVSKNGDVRIPVDGTCRNSETPINWNVQGPKGDKGDQGAPGSNLHVFDASGQDLGLLIGSTGREINMDVYTPNMKAIFSLHQARNTISGRVDIDEAQQGGGLGVYYLNENCVGAPYISSPLGPGYGIATSSKFFIDIGNDALDGNFQSVLQNYTCINRTINARAYEAKEVTAPFNLPLAWPLQIKSI